MKRIKFSPTFIKILQKIELKDKKLSKKIQKQLKLFQQNPRHKSLRPHKLTKETKNVWTISIDKSLRMLYEDNDIYYFFDIGTHDQVYRPK